LIVEESDRQRWMATKQYFQLSVEALIAAGCVIQNEPF
jgi:hypothetical protein